MRVYKFGGASVKNAEGVKNVAAILKNHRDTPLVVVISAMGKTTNALERVTEAYFAGKLEEAKILLDQIQEFHTSIARELFVNPNHHIFLVIERTFYHLYYYMQEPPGKNYDYEYDRIVSTGEVISTQIVSEYLTTQSIYNRWFHAAGLIKTDTNYRDAGVDWLKTEKSVHLKISSFLNRDNHPDIPIVVTQGFIGGTTQGFVTTLGREGSDYTAAILAYTLKADEVVIWKDVPGFLNADPKIMKNTVLLRNISYQEAIELSYYGATIIHPKTLKPLLKKNIPLRVKSFYDPKEEGSIINRDYIHDNSHPSFIFKSNQFLLSIFPKDFSFIAEHNLSRIFSEFARAGVKINLMQNSALSFSVCFDEDKIKTPVLLRNLEKIYMLKYNSQAEIITVRHYEKANLPELLEGKEILLEQKSRITLQWVVKKKLTEEGVS
jgi:aspartate kinase